MASELIPSPWDFPAEEGALNEGFEEETWDEAEALLAECEDTAELYAGQPDNVWR